MSQRIPSRRALQHLSRLCRISDQTSPCTSAKILVCHLSLSPKAICQPIRPPNRQFRFFSTSPVPFIQPSGANPDTDPQNQQPTLPDITNYYTLFPSTLPNGPPAPAIPVQSSSAKPTDPSSSTAEFGINLPTLRKEFLQLQSLHHPDKYPTGTDAHRKSLALSSLINNAYKTLSDPLSRAQYLLDLQYEIDVASEDNSAHPTDQGTLMEVMEAQERIEEATGQAEIDEIKEENKIRIRETEQKMGVAFENGDADAAKNETVRLKYWRSLQDGLNDWEPGKEVRLIH